MTSAFEDAALVMAHALGVPDHAFASIPHPVSSASDAGLAARAEATCRFVQALLAGEVRGPSRESPSP